MQRRKRAEQAQRMADELAEAEDKVGELEKELSQAEEQAELLKKRMIQTDEQIAEEEKEKKTLEEQFIVKKKALDLLDNVEKNKKALKGICDTSATKLLELAENWEQYRVPLVEKYRKSKEEFALKKAEAKEKIVKIKEL